MSEPKFTPGPWGNVDFALSNEIGALKNPLIAVVQSRYCDSPDELRANAHLIAAAPDLYRELELARFTIAMEIATMGPRTLDREEKEALIAEHPTIKSIDAALAKARGESHE